MAIPTVPVLFVKPGTAVADPYPGKIIIPKVAQDGSSDYEGELTVVIGKTGKDIKEEDAYDYILGYTSGNDVSARNAQFASSQWCYSKGNCPHVGMEFNLRLGLFCSYWTCLSFSKGASRSSPPRNEIHS
jgi:2-keto-4-pentenoate hydratase/2-oxohepta-3-ene-1,7-dioic acid hydratase in catechol pathway